MKRLSQLTLVLCLLGISGASLSKQTIYLEDSATSSPKTKLSSEEVGYIRSECEGFAKEDGISIDKRSEYLETCISELSAAVKDALEKKALELG